MEEQIYHIIAKKLSGSIITHAEEAILNHWLKDSTHVNQYDELVKIWEHTSKVDYQVEVNIDEEWNLFKVLREQHQTAKTKVRRLTYTFSSIAASIILLIGLYFIFIGQPKPITYFSNNEIRQIELPDHSSVWLNKNSSLKVDRTFSKKDRTVYLTGEAFFEVTKNPEHPFIIQTQQGIGAKVLGTSFNLRSYRDEGQIELQVVTGRVAFGNFTNNQLVYAEKGEQVSYSLTKKDFFNAGQANPNLLSWKTGLFEFNNTPFTEIIPALERYLDMKIQLPVGTEKLNYSGKFDHPTAEEIANVLSIAMGWKYEIKDNNIIFSSASKVSDSLFK